MSTATTTSAMPLDGKIALITGAAQGIGFGVAQQLGAAGASLVLADVNPDQLEVAAADLRESGVETLPLICDVRSTEQIETTTRKALAAYGQIDVLVNNAGIHFAGAVTAHTDEDWDQVVAINLSGVFKFCRAVVPAMAAAGGGAIVNIASTAAFHFTGDHIAYAATKAGVVALTRDLGYALAPQHIRVNAVSPGPIQTPLREKIPPARKEAARRAERVGRPGDPREIGDAVVFLASDRAMYIIGTTLPVAGGTDLSVFA